MTVVGLNPATPASSPRGRTLLPRNPTPWSSPEIPTLPPQVQRLLQQVGGSSYRTYQPFQVVQPLITPQPRVNFSDNPESSTTSEKPSASTSQDFESSHSSTPGVPQVNFPFSTPAFDPSTTHGTSVTPNRVQDTRLSPLPLTHLCRNRLVSHFGLRKLRRILLSMQAPKCVAKFLSTISAKECVVRSSAPLLDVFAEPFFHRAVTWRVECCLDGQPYLATYAHTDTSALACEWMTSAEVDEEPDAVSSAWLYCDHPHIMRVWGVVVDPCTGNNFYLLDTPIATLEQILTRLQQQGVRLPEPLVWGLLGGVASALLHARRCRLPCAPLHLSNVFLLRTALVIENPLTRKRRSTECNCSSSRGCSAEPCFVQNVGRIIHALCTCGTRCLHAHEDGTRTHHVSPMHQVSLKQDLRRQYSDTLLTLLARALGGGLQGPSAPSPRWERNHNGRRVFADVNQPTLLPRVKKTDNFEALDLFERKSVNGNSSISGNDMYPSTNFASPRYLSSPIFSSIASAISDNSVSLFSSSSNSFHSSLLNSSDYPSTDNEIFRSVVSDVCVGIGDRFPETCLVKLEKSSANASHDMFGLTSHSTQSSTQHHLIGNSSNNPDNQDINKTSRKLDRRPSPRDASTRPKGDPNDRKVHHEKRRKRTHQRKRHFVPCGISKENISPTNCCEDQHDVSVTKSLKGDHFTSSLDNRISATEQARMFPSSIDDHNLANAQDDVGRGDLNLPFFGLSISSVTPLRNGSYSLHSNATSTNAHLSSMDFSPISLEEIVTLAEAEVRRTCGCTLEEALRRSPRELVELATSHST